MSIGTRPSPALPNRDPVRLPPPFLFGVGALVWDGAVGGGATRGLVGHGVDGVPGALASTVTGMSSLRVRAGAGRAQVAAYTWVLCGEGVRTAAVPLQRGGYPVRDA